MHYNLKKLLEPGKKTRIMCLLKELYGSGVEKLRIKKHEFTTPSKKKLEIATLASNYHIEVTPSDAGMHDRYLIFFFNFFLIPWVHNLILHSTLYLCIIVVFFLIYCFNFFKIN